MRAQAKAREELIAKERARQEQITSTSAAESEATRKTELNRRARQEQAEVAARQARVAGVEARNTVVDTAAIEANTRAREANVRAQRAQQTAAQRARQIPLAPTGARDPAFAEAFALGGPNVTQYRIRQQLEGVGSRRATAIQAAAAQGFRPAATTGAEASRPLTRARAAEVALERAESELAQATRELTNARRRKGATDEERLALLDSRDAARKSVQAANLELETARSAAANADQVSATRRQAAALERQRAEQAAVVANAPSYIGRHQDAVEQAAAQRAQAERDQARVVAAGPSYIQRHQQTVDEAGSRRAAQLEAEAAAMSTAEREAADYARTLTAEERMKALLLSQNVTGMERGQAAAAEQSRRAVQAQGAAYGAVSDAMTRHGALTTEFIGAAARGETTLRELGNQSIATAGKFAGWTAAGAALYTAADAIKQVGTGAVQSQNGVNQLQRIIDGLDTDQAASDITGLAREFNVPIEVASDAVYRMSQRFHDLPSAVTAARAALFSLQTGDVDVPTSTDNLLAITRAFGIEASGMKPLFDQINEAQNQFGTRINETEAGLAKAGGAFRNAGGDVNYLLGLFVAIQAATNRSGQEIGTGLARGVTQIRQARNQATLRDLGVKVDPNDFQATLQSAMVQATQGADVNRLASGLLGNQYARLLAPVLRDQTTLNRALEDTSPQAAQGSADRELARVLSQLSQQARAVGVNLQAIGAELGRSGALVPFAGALRGLNGMLSASGQLLRVFNLIPSPLRDSVAVLAEMAIGLAALRRLGATDRFIGTPVGFLASPERRLRTYATRGVRDARDESFRLLQSQRRRASDLQSEAYVSRQAAGEYQASAGYRAARALPDFHPQRIEAEIRRASLEDQANAASARANEASQKSVRLHNTAKELDQELANLKDVEAKNIREYVQRRGIVMPASLDVQTTHGTRVLGPDGLPIRSDLQVPPPAGGLSPSAAAALGGTGSAELDKLLQAPTRADPKQFVKARNAVASSRQRLESMLQNSYIVSGQMEQLGRTYNGIERASLGVIGATERAVNFGSRAATGLRGMASQAGGFVRSLGLLDGALVGFLALDLVSNAVDKLGTDLEKQAQAVEAFTGDTQKQRDDIRARAASLGKYTYGQQIGDALQDANAVLNPLKIPGTIVGSLNGTYETEARKRARLRDEANANVAELDRRDALMARAQRRGTAVPLRQGGDIGADIRRASRLQQAGIISMREFDDAMAKAAIENQTQWRPTQQSIQANAALIARAYSASGGPNYARSLRKLDDKGLSAEMGAVDAGIEGLGATPRRLRQLTSDYMEAVRRYGGSTDPAAIEALNRARDMLFSRIEDTSKSELESSLAGAATEGERRTAYRTAATQLQSSAVRRLGNRVDDAQANLDNARVARDTARRAARRGPGVAAGPNTPNILGGGSLGGLPPAVGTTQKDLDDEAIAAQAEVDKYKAKRHQFREELAAANRRLENARRALREEALSDREEGRDIALALTQSRTQDPLAQANAALARARHGLVDAETSRVGIRKLRQARTAVNEALAAQAQAMAQEVEADNAVLIARAGSDPVNQAAAALQAAANAAAALPANAGHAARQQALAQTIQAREQQRQAANQLAQANFDLQSSRTEDPLAQARIARSQAADALGRATGPVERVTARAAYNRAVQGYRNARVQSKEDTINFDLEMGRITNDTAADLLKSLARTHGLSLKTKRDLLLQAKRLRDEASADQELNVDNIRIPSLYELRRFQGEAKGGQVTTVNNSPNVNLYVDGTTNMDALARTLHDVTNLPLETMARAQGVR